MRKTFTMSAAQHARLLEAMKPVPAMWIGGPPRSVQQNANDAWIALGQEMGFDGMTVRGIPGGSEFEFSAEEAPVTRPAPLPPGEAEYLSWQPLGVPVVLEHNKPLCADCTTEHACRNRLDVPRPCGVGVVGHQTFSHQPLVPGKDEQK